MSGTERNLNAAAVAFDGVSVVRGGRLIWSEGTFQVPTGGIVAVIGSNGSGKTTLLEAILGLIPVASGTVRVFGAAPGAGNDSIGYVPQNAPQNYASKTDEAIRAADVVMLGLNGSKWAFGRASAAQRRHVDEVLLHVGAAAFSGKRLSKLSGGQRQRVALAEALVAQPDMLILDEPLASLDLRSQREIVRLLGRLNQNLGVTILIVTHDLNPLIGMLTGAIYLLDGRAHYATADRVVDEALLSRLYGTRIEIAYTPTGDVYMRSI
jgi:zinc/manganese transport system ATP-binding protein